MTSPKAGAMRGCAPPRLPVILPSFAPTNDPFDQMNDVRRQSPHRS